MIFFGQLVLQGATAEAQPTRKTGTASQVTALSANVRSKPHGRS